jgi:hypothetical protein
MSSSSAPPGECVAALQQHRVMTTGRLIMMAVIAFLSGLLLAPILATQLAFHSEKLTQTAEDAATGRRYEATSRLQVGPVRDLAALLRANQLEAEKRIQIEATPTPAATSGREQNAAIAPDSQAPSSSAAAHTQYCPGSGEGGPLNQPLKSDKRGYIALMYTGSARAFSHNFRSHILNLMAQSPYTVHIYLHSWAKDLRFLLDDKTPLDRTFTEKLQRGSDPKERTVRVSDGNAPYGTFASFRSINATMDYFSGYRNLDNELVCIHPSIKGFMIEDMSIEESEARYKEHQQHIVSRGSRLHLGDDYGWRLFAMIYSQEQADRMRDEYAKANGIEYLWVTRLRTDSMIRTNLWETVFHQQPLDANDEEHVKLVMASEDETARRAREYKESFRLHDLIYKPLLDRSALYVPDGTHNGHNPAQPSQYNHGMNDQFAFSSAEVHRHYVKRSSMSDVIDCYDHSRWSDHESAAGWGGETTAYRKMNIHNIAIKFLPIGYTALRVLPRKRQEGTARFKSAETYCDWSIPLYGADICNNYCLDSQARRDEATALATRRYQRNMQRVKKWTEANAELVAEAATIVSPGLTAAVSTAPLSRADDDPFIYRVRQLTERTPEELGIGVGVARPTPEEEAAEPPIVVDDRVQTITVPEGQLQGAHCEKRLLLAWCAHVCVCLSRVRFALHFRCPDARELPRHRWCGCDSRHLLRCRSRHSGSADRGDPARTLPPGDHDPLRTAGTDHVSSTGDAV